MRISTFADACRYCRPHGIRDALTRAFFEGDELAPAEIQMILMYSGRKRRSDNARGYLIKGMYETTGPTEVIAAALKNFWYGAHDIIAALLGVDAIKAIRDASSINRAEIDELPDHFTVWRAEWQRPDHFISPVRSWALTEEEARNYLGKGKVLVSREINRSDVLLFIPGSQHARRGVNEVVLEA